MTPDHLVPRAQPRIEGLDEPLAQQLPQFELFFKTLGFKRVHGRIWGLLVLIGRPLTAKEISEALHLSQGATSTALHELTEWGAITSEFDHERRCHLHAPVSNTLSIAATVIRRREQVVFQQFKVASQRMLIYVQERYGDRDPRMLTLRSIISTCEIAEAVMQLVVGAVAHALDDSTSVLHKAVSAALKVGVVMPSRVLLGKHGLNELVAQAMRPEDGLPQVEAKRLGPKRRRRGPSSSETSSPEPRSSEKGAGKGLEKRRAVPELPRVVITGVGLSSPNGDDLASFRRNLLGGKSGVVRYSIRHVGETFAGVCNFDPLRYQTKKEARRGTRAGALSIWCAHEALRDAGLDLAQLDRSRIGVFTGITEHGNVETENQIHEVAQYGFDLSFWSHHHNPRTVANNPAGETTLNLGITGPAYSLGGACAAGNLGLIHGTQMLQLGLIDLALGGGVSESIHTFGIFASFRAQGALARHEDPAKASRPFDRDRNGIVVSEGGCLFALERLDDALARGARIYAEVAGYHVNSDASDFVLPCSKGQETCIRGALAHAGVAADEIDLVNTHATSTVQGDEVECEAIRAVFGNARSTYVNNTKSFIGHAMGAAGALELAGNLPSFADGLVHPTINVEHLDPACELDHLVRGEPTRPPRIDRILNMSFGMLGINSAVVVERFRN